MKNYTLALFVVLCFLTGISCRDVAVNSTAKNKVKVDSLNQKAKKMREQYPDSAMASAIEALELAEAIRYSDGEAEAKVQIGTVLILHSKLDSAQQYFNEVIKLGTIKPSIIADAYNKLGEVYRVLGLNFKAYDYYEQSLKIRESLGDIEKVGIAHKNIGVALSGLLMFDDAEHHFEQALLFFHQDGSSQLKARLLGNLGVFYKMKGNHKEGQRKNDEAQEYYKKALDYHFRSVKLKRQLNDSLGLAASYLNIGSVYIHKAKYDSALFYNKRALGIVLRNQGRKRRIAQVYMNLGSNYGYLGEIDSAVVYVKRGLKCAQTIQAKDVIMKSHQLLSECFAEMGEYKLAFTERKEEAKLLQIVYAEKNSQRASALRYDYEFEKKERESNIQKNRSIIAAIISATSLVFLIFFVLLNRKLKLQKTVLEEQKWEIESQREILDGMFRRGVHHDVLNDLDFIIKKLKVQKDGDSKKLLNLVQIRYLRSKYLYIMEGEQRLPLNLFISDLIDMLSAGHGRESISVKKIIADVEVYPSKAHRIALIINELVRNAFKYAFQKRMEGEISVEIIEKNGKLSVLIVDDGEGFSKNIDTNNLTSRGLKTVEEITHNLGGKLELFSNHFGTKIMISMIKLDKGEKTKK